MWGIVPSVLSSRLAISLLLSVVIVASVPVFAMLGYLKSLLILTPAVWTLLSALSFTASVFFYLAVAYVLMIVYADLALPWAMNCFAQIFARIDEDQL